MTPWLDSENPPQPTKEERLNAALVEYRRAVKENIHNRAAEYLETIATWIESPPRQYRKRDAALHLRQEAARIRREGTE